MSQLKMVQNIKCVCETIDGEICHIYTETLLTEDRVLVTFITKILFSKTEIKNSENVWLLRKLKDKYVYREQIIFKTETLMHIASQIVPVLRNFLLDNRTNP